MKTILPAAILARHGLSSLSLNLTKLGQSAEASGAYILAESRAAASDFYPVRRHSGTQLSKYPISIPVYERSDPVDQAVRKDYLQMQQVVKGNQEQKPTQTGY